MARLTRKELKKDPFLSVYYDEFIEFAQNHYQKMVMLLAVIAIVIAAGIFWKRYRQRQEVSANALLGEALTTFHAYVGQPAQGALAPGAETFANSAAKYQAALKEFTALYEKYPHQKTSPIALYHMGLCQAELGQQDAAVKTLERAGRSSDRDAASLARFALAGVFANQGKLPQAQKIFRRLAQHPTETLPAPTAWLALADAERGTNPGEARRIYQRLMKDYGSEADVVETAKQAMASLPQ